MAGPLLKDALWSRQSFIVDSKNLAEVDLQNRTYSTAENKFVDTTPGGSLVINPPPQFSMTADPKVKGVYAGSRGIGMYYNEAIEENSQVINMRFGTPKYNKLTTFFSGFYNSAAGTLARTGRATSIFYDLGRAAGMVVGVIFWPLLAAAWIGQAVRWAMGKPSSKFYWLDPKMTLYWNAVQTMFNQIMVNRGIVPRLGGNDNAGPRIGGPYEFDADALKLLSRKLPELFKGDGTIDVYAMGTRAQRLATKRYRAMQAKLDNTSSDLAKTIQDLQREPLTDSGTSFQKYRDAWLRTQNSKPKSPSGSTDSGNDSADYSEAANAGILDFCEAELNDGGAFVSFRVNSTGAVQESFSTTVGESEIATKINSASSSGRAAMFNFAGGGIVGGLAGDAIGAVMGALKDTVSGVADSLQISGLATLTGAAFADIPQYWQGSSVTLPKSNYTIVLGGPYGNPISQAINIYLPLCMILAGGMALSTGRQSYTSPFLVELYDQGRCQTRLGMIDSITVNRGTSNLGFNNEGKFMQVEVTFSVIDMSRVMHMPIAAGFDMNAMQSGINVGAVAGGLVGGATGAAAGAAAGGTVGAGIDAAAAVAKTVSTFFDDDTIFTDYMAVLGGMGMADQIYTWRRLKLQATRALTNLKTFFSAAHYASFAGDTMPARMISAIYKGTER